MGFSNMQILVGDKWSDFREVIGVRERTAD